MAGGRDLKGTKRTNLSNLKVRVPNQASRRKVQEGSKALNTGKEKAEEAVLLHSGLGTLAVLKQQMAECIHWPSVAQPVELVIV